ncbi:MAG: hypothetical protein J7M18_01945 [Candidatus Eremiobacteraeota bacterium]|nr:hypothetical protein [Candidatus Eremiobacteraeota bacterium]
MKIDDYMFGRMKIGDRVFSDDLIILPDGRIKDSWWRKQGHSICLEDLEGCLEPLPEVIVLGLGYSSCMKVPGSVRQELEKQGVKLVDLDTSSAVREYNKLQEKHRVLGAFHLTC